MRQGDPLPQELKRDEKRRTLEVKGQKFDFIEMQSAEPSDVALLHLPGFGSDGEEYAEGLHYSTDRKHDTLALKGYGEVYSKENLVEALGKAIQLSGKGKVVLHGNSFGASIVYDLISDPGCREFLKTNNIVGAILETPVLDRNHLKTRLRLIAGNTLVQMAVRFNKVRGISDSIIPSSENNKKVSDAEAVSTIQEALRDKTVDRKIEVPVYAVFTQDESLSDNAKITSTLQGQAVKFSSDTVPSSKKSSGHHVEDYENMWRGEEDAIASFM